jgi:hypothetical protein
MDVNPEPVEDKPKRLGRPSGYSAEVALRICERLAEGETLLEICSDPAAPSFKTVYRWVESRDDFRQMFARAREEQGHYFFELMWSIAKDDKGDIFIDGQTGSAVADHARILRHRLQIDTLKFKASKLNKRAYGDHKPVDDSETVAGGPLTVRWINNEAPATPPPEPRRLEYKRPQLPADLSERDWSLLMAILERIKARTPADAEKPPGEVLEAVAKTIDALYADLPENVRPEQPTQSQKA